MFTLEVKQLLKRRESIAEKEGIICVDVACWYILYLKIISGCWVTYLMFSGEKGFIVELT